MLEIRPCGTENIPIIRSLAFAIWPDAYGDIITPQQMDYMLDMMYSEAALQKQMNSGHQFIIGYYEDQPVAFASYSVAPNNNTHYRLHKIYISTAMQGKGVGKHIIQYLLNDIQPKGALTIELNVNRHNKAKLFYEKLGFSVIRNEDNDIGNGYFMNDYVMQKTLQ